MHSGLTIDRTVLDVYHQHKERKVCCNMLHLNLNTRVPQVQGVINSQIAIYRTTASHGSTRYQQNKQSH